MAKHKIKLPNGEWEYDDSDPLGTPGGFGAVFLGRGEGGDVAIKRLHLSAEQAAHRELKIGEQLMQRDLTHVVPVLDAGQDTESDQYFLVMPVCDRSLEEKIDESDEGVDIETAREATTAIIAGLREVGDITHRDLKPGNILFHEGIWKIADFGIAKFVEDSTSRDTLRDSLTPPYAAPEQWRGERPTTATDIYALGCIIHSLMNGQPPFVGSVDDVRQMHLETPPTPINKLSSRHSVFVSHMLRKPPDARPTLARCFEVLPEIELDQEGEFGPHQEFAVAAKRVAAHKAQEQAKREAAETRRREREILFEDAKRELLEIRDRLFDNIKQQSEDVQIQQGSVLTFGFGSLELKNEPTQLSEMILARHARGGKAYQHSGWDVLGFSTIAVTCHRNPSDRTYSWSASLLYADRNDGNGYRWYEVAFFDLDRRRRDEPFALAGQIREIDLALGNIAHSTMVAYGPVPIDGEDEERFFGRWMELVAKAATGDLEKPNSLPIRDIS